MVADKMAQTKWYGQNGMAKVVYEHMVRTKWYGQTCRDKMVL